MLSWKFSRLRKLNLDLVFRNAFLLNFPAAVDGQLGKKASRKPILLSGSLTPCSTFLPISTTTLSDQFLQIRTIKMMNTQPFMSATRRVLFCLGDSLTDCACDKWDTFFPYSLRLQKYLRELDGLELIQVQTLKTFRGLPLAALRTSLRITLNRMSKTCKPLLLTLIGIQDVMEGADCNTIVQSIIKKHQDAH